MLLDIDIRQARVHAGIYKSDMIDVWQSVVSPDDVTLHAEMTWF